MDPPEHIDKYLGVHHDFKEGKSKDSAEFELSMKDFFKSSCDAYTEKTGQSLKAAETPYAPELPKEKTIELMKTPGKYGEHAPSLLMKPLYGARAARPDLCVPIQQLSSEVTRWSAECDRRIHRMYCYIFGTTDFALKGRLSKVPGTKYWLKHWPDADLAGNPFTAKSASGGWLELVDDKGNSFPISWGTKKQDCTANHTAEAETFSMSTWLRGDGMPAQVLLSLMLKQPVPLEILEDNSSCIVAVAKGYSPAMRYLPRADRISLDFLCDATTETGNPKGDCQVKKVDTKVHKGDFFTKALNVNDFLVGRERIGLTG